MANVCDNTFYAYSEDKNNLKVIENFFKETFDEYVDIDDTTIDAWFESKWVFPEELMNKLFDVIPNKEDIYMRCLSVEYGCMYHALWECDENGWTEV